MKRIKGYPNYRVTQDGMVYSLPNASRSGVRLLKQRLNKYGYKTVGLMVLGRQKTVKVHRLVALAYIPNPSSKPQVNHLNEIKSDNRVQNLQWVTARENILHSVDTQYSRRNGDWLNQKLSKLDLSDVRMFYKSGLFHRYDIARVYGVSISLIEKVIYAKPIT